MLSICMCLYFLIHCFEKLLLIWLLQDLVQVHHIRICSHLPCHWMYVVYVLIFCYQGFIDHKIAHVRCSVHSCWAPQGASIFYWQRGCSTGRMGGISCIGDSIVISSWLVASQFDCIWSSMFLGWSICKPCAGCIATCSWSWGMVLPHKIISWTDLENRSSLAITILVPSLPHLSYS